ncbi:MAG: asparaginase [Candidatus Nanopelagicales bacterium]
MTSHIKLIDVTRNGLIESEHFGSVVLNDAGIGKPAELMFPRSTLKLFQAASVLNVGVELTSEQTAIAAASHSGEPIHIEVVTSMLQQFGLTKSDLRCTPRFPLGTKARLDAIKAGLNENELMSDCSGKHASFLAACVLNDWPLDGYLDQSHPLQVAIRSNIEKWLGITITVTGIDGCGAPVFAMSLYDLARGFQLALNESSELSPVAKAMMAHPELVGGVGRLATEVMKVLPGSIAKDGAEGVFVLADHRGVLAIKVSDGSIRPHAPIVKAVLGKWGVDAELPTQIPLGGGEPVGEILLSDDLRELLTLRLQ